MAQKEVENLTYPYNLASLAAGYAGTGKFGEAIAIQKKYIDLLKQQGKAEELNKHLEVLDVYKTHKPWREKIEIR